MREYLKTHLSLELHPNKIYLQHFSKGVKFLGTIIKPRRIYIQNRTKGNFYKKIRDWNSLLAEKQGKMAENDLNKFLAGINSYLGLMKHYKTYKLRKKMLTENLSPHFWNYFSVSKKYDKIFIKKEKIDITSKGNIMNPTPALAGVSGRVFYEQFRLRRYLSCGPSSPMQSIGVFGHRNKNYEEKYK